MPPGQGTRRLWEGMIPGTVTMKYREAFKRWEQKALLDALPEQCVKRWFTYFANMNG